MLDKIDQSALSDQSVKGWAVQTGLKTLKVCVFTAGVVTEITADVARLGSDLPAMERALNSSKESFAKGDLKQGFRHLGNFLGLSGREVGRATVIVSVVKNVAAKFISVAEREPGLINGASRAGRIDYSKEFSRDIARNFKPGYRIFEGRTAKDIVLVQFHPDKVIGAGRSLKYWTSVDEANAFTSTDDIMHKLAILPEWGERGAVSVARIPKGTEVSYCVGIAQLKKSPLTSEVFRGGGKQYLFKDFDPSWIVERRTLN